MGGAQAIAALAYGTETVDAGRRDRRARATPTCRRPSASSSGVVGIDGIAGPTRAGRDRRRRAPTRDWSRSTSPPRPSTARTACSRWRAPSDALLDAVAARGRRARGERPTRLGRAAGAGARRRASTRPSTLAERDRARAPRARCARTPTRSRRDVRAAGCVFLGRRRRRVRRLRRRLQPRAADRRRGALRGAARSGDVSAPAGAGIVARAGRAGARAARRAASLAPRASRCTRSPRRQPAAGTPRPHGEDDLDGDDHTTARGRRSSGRPRRPRSACGWRSTASGAPSFAPASASSTTCSTCSRATAGSTSRCAQRATSRPARTTRPRTSASCSAQALDEALGDRSGITRYGDATVPMDESLGALRDRHQRPAVLLLRGGAAADLDRRLRHRAGGGVLPRGRQQRQADAAPAGARGRRTRTT